MRRSEFASHAPAAKEKPMLIICVRASATPATLAVRHIIAMEPGSGLTLIEAFVTLPGAAAKGLTSALSDVTVADGAALTHIKCALDGAAATHLASWTVKVGARAGYRAFQLTAEGRNGLFTDHGVERG